MRSLGEILPGVVGEVGRRALARHLERASKASDAAELVAAFREGDHVRDALDLSWFDLLGVEPEIERDGRRAA